MRYSKRFILLQNTIWFILPALIISCALSVWGIVAQAKETTKYLDAECFGFLGLRVMIIFVTVQQLFGFIVQLHYLIKGSHESPNTISSLGNVIFVFLQLGFCGNIFVFGLKNLEYTFVNILNSWAFLSAYFFLQILWNVIAIAMFCKWECEDSCNKTIIA